MASTNGCVCVFCAAPPRIAVRCRLGGRKIGPTNVTCLDPHEARDPGPFNYPIEVFPDWRGKAFYLCARFRARSRRPEDDFVIRHARMTLTGFGRFDLAYFRHTDRWFTVYSGLTAADCFKEIEGNEIFWPTT